MELVNEQPTRDMDSAMESSENFQKFIVELFEKNGILTDLRAYLRGHIVSVLKNAHIGSPLPCQKVFTQRLDLVHQAVNILIVEYLLKSEFNYSLSVFVSELPLSNMVFELSKTMMNSTDFTNLVESDLKFVNEDIMCVLKYLGIQCDSTHVKKLLDLYKTGKTPLLLCILKCIPLYDSKEVVADEEIRIHQDASEISMSSMSSCNSDSKIGWRSRKDECKHLNQCKVCQKFVLKLKEKYKLKKEQVKSLSANNNHMNMEILMKDIGDIEKQLIDEMFNQLKSVYESEIENMRQNESKKLKKTLVAHAMFLQQKRNDLEAAYEKRRLTLENDINQKKKFLWALAQSLRKQHAAVIQAMKIVKEKATALNDQEGKLQNQLKDAEQILEKRSEDIRVQITNELTVLEHYLETVKQEKMTVSEARFKLENFKRICEDSNPLKLELESQDSKEHLTERYKSLKKELLTIRDKIDNTKSKSDVNELFNNLKDDYNFDLNNQFDEKPSTLLVANKVNNELRNKNCNFQKNTEEAFCQRLSNEALQANEVVNALKEENKRLKEFAEQQRQHIDKLSSSEQRLQMELISARTAAVAMTSVQPATEPFYVTMQRASESVTRPSCAGEELNVIDPGRRHLNPDDEIPFITGNIQSSNQHSRHMSPVRLRSSVRLRTEINKVNNNAPRPMSAGPHDVPNCAPVKDKPKTHSLEKRRKSPTRSPVRNRDISPSSVLREAKSRLRKLKIEADAVEQSYLDYKRRQTVDSDCAIDEKPNNTVSNKQVKFSAILDKRYADYETKCNLGDHYKNKNTAIQIVKPIPKQYCFVMDQVQGDLIEKPMDEFRKLYRSSRPSSPIIIRKNSIHSEINAENKSLIQELSERKNLVQPTTHNNNQNELREEQEACSEITEKSKKLNESQAKNYCMSSCPTDYSIAPNEDEIDFKDLIAIDMPKYYDSNDPMLYVEATSCNDGNTIFSKDVISIDTPTPSNTEVTFGKENCNKESGDQNYEMQTVDQNDVSNDTIKERPERTVIMTQKFENTDINNLNNELENEDQLHAIYKNGSPPNNSNEFINNDVIIFDPQVDKIDDNYSDESIDIKVRFDESADTMKNSSMRKSDEDSFWDS